MSVKRIAVLTSGGDAPGMNAAIRAVARTAMNRGIEVFGVYRGYNGLINGDMVQMNLRSVSDIIHRGGTMLYTARSPEFRTEEGMQKAIKNCREAGIEGVVVIGGDGSFRGAQDLTRRGLPCIGIPGTIDNDIASTDMTIGFDTAMNTVVELVDKLRDTGESHARCNVVEVMGREAGDIALNTSIAVGAVTAVIKEIPTDFEYLFHKMAEARKNGKRNFIIITCEGMGPGYSEQLCNTIEEKTGIETRLARLAHVQRGGSPSLRDRVLATQMGCAAVESLVAGQMKRVVCLRDNSIITMDIHEALLLDKMMKNTLTPAEREQIAPNALFDMTTRIAEMQAYKQYLNYIIDHMAL